MTADETTHIDDADQQRICILLRELLDSLQAFFITIQLVFLKLNIRFTFPA